MKAFCFAGLMVLVVVFIAGCSGGSSDKKGQPDKEHDIKGKVVSVDAKKSEVTLHHEDIPGLMMEAMTMSFKVEDAKLLEGIKEGDQVQGKVKKTDSGYLITQLEKQ